MCGQHYCAGVETEKSGQEVNQNTRRHTTDPRRSTWDERNGNTTQRPEYGHHRSPLVITRQPVLQFTMHNAMRYHQSSIGACRWRTAVPVSIRQADLFCALRSPDASPRLNCRRSSSTVLSQVCLGRPGRRLQFLGAGDMQAGWAREWSCDLSSRATWPNNFRR